MKALSVIELAKLYGMNRQSIYKRINKGDLSKNSDGKIDLAEAIRVFGEPSHRSNPNVTTLQPPTVQKSAEVDILKQQIDMLQKQLELAQEREQFQREQLKSKDDQIYSLQLLLGAPKPQPSSSPDSQSTADLQAQSNNSQSDDHVPNPNPNNTLESTMATIKATEKVQSTETKHRGLFARVIRAVLD